MEKEQAVQLMTTQAVAERLCNLLRTNDVNTIYDELFSEDAINVEPPAADGTQSITKGKENIRQKSAQYDQNIEKFHAGGTSDPVIAGRFIAISSWIDVTMKEHGRVKMEEIALYEVVEGKIVAERFFH